MGFLFGNVSKTKKEKKEKDDKGRVRHVWCVKDIGFGARIIFTTNEFSYPRAYDMGLAGFMQYYKKSELGIPLRLASIEYMGSVDIAKNIEAEAELDRSINKDEDK